MSAGSNVGSIVIQVSRLNTGEWKRMTAKSNMKTLFLCIVQSGVCSYWWLRINFKIVNYWCTYKVSFGIIQKETGRLVIIGLDFGRRKKNQGWYIMCFIKKNHKEWLNTKIRVVCKMIWLWRTYIWSAGSFWEVRTAAAWWVLFSKWCQKH